MKTFPHSPFLFFAMVFWLNGCAFDDDALDALDTVEGAVVTAPGSLVPDAQAAVFALAAAQEKDWAATIPGDGRTVVVELQTTSGDADLYVGWTTALSHSSFSCASIAGGTTTDRCSLAIPNDGVTRTLYVKARAPSAASRAWVRVVSRVASGLVVNGAGKTYSVPSGGGWYYLETVLPASVKRAAVYGLPLTGSDFTMKIGGCTSDRPGLGLEWCEVQGNGAAQTLKVYVRSQSGATFDLDVDGTDRLFTFPMQNLTGSTAPLNSVFDHELVPWYTKNGVVTDAWGEVGKKESGFVSDCYKQPGGAAFTANGNYTGAGHPTTLCYDGHAGIDFRANGATLVAACSGSLYVPTSDSVNGSPAYFGTFAIDCGGGWSVWYLHAASHNPAGPVQAGQVVGKSGAKGAPGAPHLHVEVRRYGVPVDPYGWSGATRDPMWMVPAVRLW